MRKVLHKVKSQWVVLGVMGATVVALGTANVQQVAAAQVDYNATITRDTDAINTAPWGTEGFETIGISADYLDASVSVSQEEVADNGVTWALVSLDGTELGWIAKDALTVQTPAEIVTENYAQIVSETSVDYLATISRETDAINTAPWGLEGYQTIGSSTDHIGKSVTVSKEQVTDYGVTWALVSLDGQELGWIAKDALTVIIPTYAEIVSETLVDYSATISRDTDAINTAPWDTKGYQTIGSSADHIGKSVTVSKEQVTNHGVTWALVSLDGTELGWVAKDALTVIIPTYAEIVSETLVDYSATISRDTDAINTAPWDTKGYQTIGSSADHIGKSVTVSKEQVTNHGVTWALVSLDGTELGWIAKDALTVIIPTYAEIVSETLVDYSATISRDTDAINTAPWDTKGYQTIGSSADHIGKSVTVSKEQVTNHGVTWALVSLDGTELGWIAKDALTVIIPTYAEIISETLVDYSATISRDTDAINTAPWDTKGYQTIGSSADYVGQTVEVTKEQVTDYGVTWALVSLDGTELGWIAKDALTVIIPTYAEIVSETLVDYPATISRDTDAINTAPWDTKGYQTIGSSADYVGQTVEVTKEQVTDYGVAWALVSLDGQELGWIAKDALTARSYAQIVSETTVDYPATISRDTDAINTAPWDTKGYQTIGSSADYVGKSVTVSKEQVTNHGVIWALVSLDGQEIGWIAKDALTVLETTVETVVEKENVVAFEIVNQEDSTIPTGESKVVQAGAEGYDTVTYDVTYVNGAETNRVEVSRETTAPVNEIVQVGTQVTEVKSETTTENEVAYATVEEEDNTIPAGERVVVQAGAEGYDTVTYDVTYVNGAETNRVEVSRETTAPVNEIVQVGTQVTEVKSETTTENEVAYATVEEEDNTIPTGERVVVQAGAEGYDTVTYDVTYVNGAETNRVEVSRETTAPVDEIVQVGTQVTEVKSETTTENEVAYATVEEEDNTIPAGERVVVQAGADGYDTVTYDVTYVNGVETNRVEVSRETTAPVDEIVQVGTQVTEVKSETTTENEVAYATVEEEDNTIPAGERVVVQAGADGYDTVTYDVTYVNGVETNRVEVSRETTAPVDEIVQVGTQVTEVKSETTTENEVAYATVEEEDNTIPAGERVVVQAGADGYDTVTYDVTYVNGVETNRVEVSRETTAAVNETVKVGTQITEIKAETTIEKEVAFTTVLVPDNTVPKGKRVVVQVGVNGYDTVKYDVTYVNGVETGRVETSRTTTAPVDEIVRLKLPK